MGILLEHLGDISIMCEVIHLFSSIVILFICSFIVFDTSNLVCISNDIYLSNINYIISLHKLGIDFSNHQVIVLINFKS